MFRQAATGRRILTLGAVAALASGLGACASRTPVSGSFPPITPRDAQSNRYTGRTVRWGGVLISTEPQRGATCFRVMALPLDSDGRPEMGSGVIENGRFLACASGFYDPVLYAQGRRITFVGTIAGVETQAVGGYRYPYPRLNARVVYLWPQPQTPASPSPAYYNGPWNYGWGPWGWWGPGWVRGYPWWGWPQPPPRPAPPPRPRPPPRPLPPPTPKPGRHPPPASMPPAPHRPPRPQPPPPVRPATGGDKKPQTQPPLQTAADHARFSLSSPAR